MSDVISEGMSIGFMSVWLVCTVLATIALHKFLSQAKKKHPEQYARMVERSKRNARWVGRTYLINPAKDIWRDR